jgi:hypothetical protein
MYGSWYKFLVHAKHKKSHQQQNASMGGMDMNNVVLSFGESSPGSPKETPDSAVAIEQGYCLWRRNIRFKKCTDRDIALIH